MPSDKSQGSDLDALSDTLEAPLETRSRARRDPELGPPVSLDRYELREVLGIGGMGRVYRAFDREMELEVALKTLHHLDPEQVLQLKSEFRALLGMSHRNLVELYELFVDGDNCFFTLELLEGVQLDQFLFEDLPRDLAAESSASQRLAEVVRQLCAGLRYLHASGKLHRDIKPSNILVADGRVVILDFGLVTRFGSGAAALDSHTLVGTLPYMSPEQLWGAEPTPAMDCYALGVLLYELVTGRLPFTQDNPGQHLEEKQRHLVTPPKQLIPSLGDAMNDVIVALLDPDPATRASLDDLLAAFELSDPSSMTTLGAPCVGRQQELERLERFALDPESSTRLVTVEGESGVGKSTLLAQLCEQLEAKGALVLRGRCHPHESIPYNAFDALVDALSRHLERMETEEVQRLRPRRLGALTQLFPVLRHVPGLASDSTTTQPPERRELRRQGFGALSEFLGRLCLERPVVLWLDDVQWGDADSAALLRELLTSEDSPECLFILSYRERTATDFRFLASLGELTAGLPQSRHLHLRLEPLGLADSRLLARRLLGPDANAVLVEAIVKESGGSPFLIGELAQGSDDELLGASRPSLNGLVERRMQRFVRESRTLLGVVAVAGGPLARSVALDAADLGEHGRPLVHRLEKGCLLRLTKVDGAAAVEAYHHRIREAVIQGMSSEQLRDVHQRLALALERTEGPDPEALMTHHLGADNAERGAYWTVRAAERADQILAFDRAAQRYRLALTQPLSPLSKAELHERLGLCLVNVGRGADAAAHFEAAATQLPQGEESAAFNLRLRSAEQYLRSGHFDKGQALLYACLDQVNLRPPKSPGQAARISGSRRMLLLAKGMRAKTQRSKEAPDTRRRLDALWTATTSLSMVAPVYADAFGVQHLGEALTSGSASRLVRAYAYEAVCEACVGGEWLLQRSRKIVEQAAQLAAETGDPYDRAWVSLALGCCAWCRCEWSAAAEHCDAAARIFAERCQGAAWERATAEVFALSSLSHAGRVEELQQRLPALLDDALAREDLFAANQYRLGQHSLLWLCRDEPAHALAYAKEAERSTVHIQHHLQHYSTLVAAAPAELYQGNAVRASDRIEGLWPTLQSSLTMRLAGARVELVQLRARAALARATHHEGKEQKAWLKLADKQATRLMKEQPAHARAWAHLLHAGIARLRGKPLEQKLYLTEAIRQFERNGMRLYAAVSRFADGEPEALAELSVKNPRLLSRALAPGLLPDD